MRPVTVEFAVSADLTEQGFLSCTWTCQCGRKVDARGVRAHVVGHAHEQIGVPS